MVKKFAPLLLVIIAIIIFILYQSTKEQKETSDKKGKLTDIYSNLLDKTNPDGKTIIDYPAVDPGNNNLNRPIETSTERIVRITVSVTDNNEPLEGVQICAIIENHKSGNKPQYKLKYGEGSPFETEGGSPISITTDKNGKGFVEISYASDLTQNDTLSIWITSPLSARNYLNLQNNYADLDSLYKNLCYSKKQSLTLSKPEENPTVNFECFDVASATIQVDHQHDNRKSIPASMPIFTRIMISIPEMLYAPLELYSFIDGKGKATLEIPAEQETELIFIRDGYPDKIEKIEPLSPGQNKFIKVYLERGPKNFTGKCVDKEGKPVAGTTIFASQDGLSQVSAYGDDHGGFTLEGLLDKPIKELKIKFNKGKNVITFHRINLDQRHEFILDTEKSLSTGEESIEK
ncbi:MAG: hypothetical protein HY606_07290 [Planctomycetes bacterium]|nr:hypothetical protein [Planctomycetota bacterium]